MRKVGNRVAVFGVFTALALIFSYIELLIPVNFGIPGAKLGLANLVTVIVLCKTDWREALLLSVVRVVLAGFLFGNLFGILYSLAGGLLSVTVMAALKKTGAFSVIGVSMAGGVSHNIGQRSVSMLIVEARMEWADCPDQVCVNHRAVERDGESIICLPNKVVVSVESSEANELDGIAQ